MIQALWLVLLTWKSLWVMLLLAMILFVRFFYQKSVSNPSLIGAIIILIPLLLGLSGNRFFSINNVQIICTLFMVLALFRPLRKEFVQNIFVVHLFILGLVLYNQTSVFIFVLMFFDSLFVIALIFVSEQYPLTISSLRELTGNMLKVLLQTIPFIILFYGLIPALNLKNNTNFDTTFSGASFSKEVKPGTTDKLILSDRPVFSARFLSKNLPIRDDFYWRTQVFPFGEELNWKLNSEEVLKEANKIELEDDIGAFFYHLWPEKELYPIVPTLEHFAGVHISETNSYVVNNEGSLQMVELPKEGQSIALVGSLLPLAKENGSPSQDTKIETTNPPSQRIKDLIESWQGSSGSPEDFFQLISNFFQKNNFVYTLTPGKVHSAEQFLFESKAGFCEHYATVTAYLFRLAGYQARVVAGFQGGEPASEPGVWEVTGKDAHAWLEVWSQESRIWQRYDPVLFIAPERIKWGGQRYFSLMERGALANLFPEFLRSFVWKGLRHAKQWAFYIQSLGDKLIDEFIEFTKRAFDSFLMILFLILLIISLVLIPIFRSRRRIVIRVLDVLFEVYLRKNLNLSSSSQNLFFKEQLIQELKENNIPSLEHHEEFIQAWLTRRYDPSSSLSDWRTLLLAFLKLRKQKSQQS